MRRRAFSLIELLTVVAILAILAAILMPVFIQVKMLAQKYVAGQSMMKLSMVTTMYAGDYDDTYPLAYYPAPNGGRQNWFGRIDRFGEVVPESGLLHSYVSGRIQPDATLNAKPWQGDVTGYGYNWGHLGSDFYEPGGLSDTIACRNPAQASALGSPSDTILYGTSVFFFAGWLEGGDDTAYRYGFIDPPRTWFGIPTLDFRHMGERKVDKRRHEVTSTGTALVVHADGHLATMDQKKVKNQHFERRPDWESDSRDR